MAAGMRIVSTSSRPTLPYRPISIQGLAIGVSFVLSSVGAGRGDRPIPLTTPLERGECRTADGGIGWLTDEGEPGKRFRGRGRRRYGGERGRVRESGSPIAAAASAERSERRAAGPRTAAGRCSLFTCPDGAS